MKKSIIVLRTMGFLMLAFLSVSCNSPAENVQDAKEDLQDAKENLEDAERAYMHDIENYRASTNKRIDTNDELTVEMKSKLSTIRDDAKEEYKKNIMDLEQRNRDLRRKMREYNKAQGKENWENFKKEFNHDMQELEDAFDNLGRRNVR